MTTTDKRALRMQFMRIRAAVKSPERDEALLQSVLVSRFMRAESFFVYCSMKSEAATDKLIAALLAAGKRVCVPRLQGGVMLAVPYGELEEGAFGIPAPRGGEDTPCDVVFAPLLAFDGRGTRLGYGGGYYDAYFASRPAAVRVGLAYAAQRADRLPREPHDVLLHAVVTEEGAEHFPNA